MGRRRRKPGDPPDSTHWSSYRPGESKYWFYGGPWVPPEKIEPAKGYSADPEHIRPYEKPATRFKSVSKMLDEAIPQLAQEIEHYRDLHERGVEALPWDWMRDKIRNGQCDRNEPNHLHYSLCNCYGNIARLKAMIPVYEQIIDGLTPGQMPLFARRKDS
jgi:hypothetical protein